MNPSATYFGPGDTPIQFIDGAAVLGYIFSIVRPAQGITPTCQSYWLPMLLLCSRCLYLAFVTLDDKEEFSHLGVPNMANIMYHHPKSMSESFDYQEWPYMFGATLPGEAHGDKNFKENRDLASAW